MTTYRFNTGTAQHTFCRTCGIHAFYVPRSDPDKYSVNARYLEDFDPETMRPGRFFDGRQSAPPRPRNFPRALRSPSKPSPARWPGEDAVRVNRLSDHR